MKRIGEEIRLGETRKNKYGTEMKIIRYRNAGDITVEFQDEHKFTTHATYSNFTRGMFNPYDKTIFDIGYYGTGDYVPRRTEFENKMYDIWRVMIQRCYSTNEKTRENYSCYTGCTMSDDWHNFQNFAKWYDENYYDLGDNKRMHVDKDILIKGNKLYSSETCLLIPQKINMIFMSKSRSDDLPNCIIPMKNGKYKTRYNTTYLATSYDSTEDAVKAHDIEKRIHIREVINECGDKLPEKVKIALLAW